jgi:hypothetical protein
MSPHSKHEQASLAGRVRHARAAAHRPDDGDAFLPDPSARGHHAALLHTDVEFAAEEFIASATAAAEVTTDAEDEISDEERDVPYVEIDGETGEYDLESEIERVAEEEPEPSRPGTREP